MNWYNFYHIFMKNLDYAIIISIMVEYLPRILWICNNTIGERLGFIKI